MAERGYQGKAELAAEPEFPFKGYSEVLACCPFTVQVLPVSFMTFETRKLVELERFSILEILGYEFDLASLVTDSATTEVYNREKAPIHLVNGFGKLLPEIGVSSVWVGGFDEVLDLAEEIGAITRPHELLGCVRLGLAIVEWLAADVVV